MTPSKQATVSEMKNESGTEIFDDLYLGVRAGGALRKKRRGELLTAEEAEALGRWQSLSAWRKGLRRRRLHRRAPSGSASPSAASSSAAGAKRPDELREPLSRGKRPAGANVRSLGKMVFLWRLKSS